MMADDDDDDCSEWWMMVNDQLTGSGHAKGMETKQAKLSVPVEDLKWVAMVRFGHILTHSLSRSI